MDGAVRVELTTVGFKAQRQQPSRPIEVVGEVGIEPTHAGTKNRWLTTCLLPKEMGDRTAKSVRRDQPAAQN